MLKAVSQQADIFFNILWASSRRLVAQDETCIRHQIRLDLLRLELFADVR